MSRRKQVNPQHLSLTHRETIPGELKSSHDTLDLVCYYFQNENIVFSDSRDCECKKMLKQGSISPTKTLFCGNTFNDVVTLGAPRRGKTAILIRLQSVFKLVSGHFYVE